MIDSCSDAIAGAGASGNLRRVWLLSSACIPADRAIACWDSCVPCKPIVTTFTHDDQAAALPQRFKTGRPQQGIVIGGWRGLTDVYRVSNPQMTVFHGVPVASFERTALGGWAGGEPVAAFGLINQGGVGMHDRGDAES